MISNTQCYGPFFGLEGELQAKTELQIDLTFTLLTFAIRTMFFGQQRAYAWLTRTLIQLAVRGRLKQTRRGWEIDFWDIPHLSSVERSAISS